MRVAVLELELAERVDYLADCSALRGSVDEI